MSDGKADSFEETDLLGCFVGVLRFLGVALVLSALSFGGFFFLPSPSTLTPFSFLTALVLRSSTTSSGRNVFFMIWLAMS